MLCNAVDDMRRMGASRSVSSLPCSSPHGARRRGALRACVRAGVLVAGLLLAGAALALQTGTWTVNGSTSANTSVNGIAVTWTGNADEGYVNGTFNAANDNWWTDPYGGAVNNGASLTVTHDAGTRNYTVAFGKPVDNPVLHIDRMGGYVNNNPNSSRWTLAGSTSQGGAVTLSRLSGNAQFVLAGNAFYRQTGSTFSGTGSAECLTGTAAPRGTACGSIRFNGSGITSLTFSIGTQGPAGGDQLEMRWSFEGSRVVVRKQTVGGTGTFGITASGALAQAFTLATTAQNTPVSSAVYPVTNHAAAITLTESTVPAGYVLTAATCTDQSGAAVAATVDPASRQVVVPAANYRANQTLTCTLTNSAQATLALAKTWVNAAVNDTAVLSATGGANTASLSSTANAASETDTGAAVQVLPGNVIALSETLGAGNARTYVASAWNCTGGTLSGSTLTIASAHAGQAIVCTITNTARVADVSVVKSPPTGSAVSGDVRAFTVVVANAGPGGADGTVVDDAPGAGLACPATGNPITCSASGGAACPGAGALPNLVSGGVAVPALPPGGTVTFTVPCRVTATGL